jgi:hypothetical protein
MHRKNRLSRLSEDIQRITRPWTAIAKHYIMTRNIGFSMHAPPMKRSVVSATQNTVPKWVNHLHE